MKDLIIIGTLGAVLALVIVWASRHVTRKEKAQLDKLREENKHLQEVVYKNKFR